MKNYLLEQLDPASRKETRTIHLDWWKMGHQKQTVW